MKFNFPMILDGATGSQLISRGLPPGVCQEEWIADNPQIISELQREYEEAGSNLVLAPTFGAISHKLAHFGLSEKSGELNRRLLEISRSAVSDDTLVAADVSPTGLFIAPYGEESMASLVKKYEEQLENLTEADVIVSETNMAISDARAAVIAAKKLCSKPIFVTFTVDEDGRTMMGATARAALCIFRALGVSAFGLNCGTGPDGMLKVFRDLSEIAEGFPLIAKPNAGLPTMRDGKETYDLSPSDFSSYAEELYSLGVRIFGGCCGTGPSHIAALSKEARRLVPALETAKGHTEYLSTERVLVAVSDVLLSNEIEVSGFVADDLMECFDTCPLVRIRSLRDVKIIEENQHAAQNPIVFACEDKELLGAALLSYNGRAGVKSENRDVDETALFYGAYILR